MGQIYNTFTPLNLTIKIQFHVHIVNLKYKCIRLMVIWTNQHINIWGASYHEVEEKASLIVLRYKRANAINSVLKVT